MPSLTIANSACQHLALFVHVPEYRNVVFEDQVALASKIVDLVADL